MMPRRFHNPSRSHGKAGGRGVADYARQERYRMRSGSHQVRRGRTATGQRLRPSLGAAVASFFPLVLSWTVTPRAPALVSRAPIVRLSQAAPAEAGAGVLYSRPLLKESG